MIKYFVYSEEQRKFREKIEATIGKKFYPGKVKVSGKYVEFTEISDDASLKGVRTNDAIIVASGDPNDMDVEYPRSSLN